MLTSSKTKLSAALIWMGCCVFLLVVIFLHLIQVHYDARYQLMSELVFGKGGEFMLIAFLGLSLAAFGTGRLIIQTNKNTMLAYLFDAAAVCFLGSGIFPLGESGLLHITCIALAFTFMVLGMCWCPFTQNSLMSKSVSLGLAAALTLSVFTGQSLLDIGIAQRLAASCLLCWWIILGWRGKHKIES